MATDDDSALKKGDDVTWRSHGQTVHGTVDDPTGLLDEWRERGAVTW